MMAQHWMLAWFFRGSAPVLQKNYIFVVFQGGVRTPCPPLDPPMQLTQVTKLRRLPLQTGGVY